MKFDPQNPQPGRYDDVPIEVYHGGSGSISRSALKLFEDGTARDVQHYLQNGITVTDDMRLGTAIDLLVFEPEREEEALAVLPTFKETKVGLRNRMEWLADRAGGDRPDVPDELPALRKEIATLKECLPFTLLSEGAYREARLISQAVLAAPSVKALLKDIEPQPSYFYDVDGTLARTRPDAIANGFAFDLKSVRSMSERHRWTAIVDGAYDVQQANFREGMMSVGEEWKAGVIVWAGKDAPYDVHLQLIEAGDAVLDLGEMRGDRWLRQYAECVRTNRWPDRSGLIQKMHAPKWIGMKLAAEIEREDERLRAERNKENAA